MIGDDYTFQSEYRDLASQYVRSKSDPRLYIFNYDLDWVDDPMPYYHSLTMEQVEQVRAMLAECEEQNVELYEYFDEREFPEFLMPHQEELYHIPASMELDTPYHTVGVKVAIFYDGIGEQPEVANIKIAISEKEYIELLDWQLNRREASFNDLLHNTELYKSISDNISYTLFGQDHCNPWTVPTYAVELTQIKAEAIELCGEDRACCDIYIDLKNGINEKSEHIFLDIKDRVLLLYYETFGEGLPYTIREVIDVDAIAVERALGVECYKELCKAIKERFGTADGLDRFVEFLSQHNIAHMIKNSENSTTQE